MQSILIFLAGKKTYLLMAFGALVVLVNHFFPIPGLGIDPNNWVQELYALGGGATLRAAVGKVEKKV